MLAGPGDERGLSEASGVALLVGATILVTATVGLNVVLFQDLESGKPTANFSYDHVEASSTLVITHSEGDSFPAGAIVISGQDAETTWAAVADVNETEEVGPGDIAQIGEANAFGQPVRTSSQIRIYLERDGNRTQLSQWPPPGEGELALRARSEDARPSAVIGAPLRRSGVGPAVRRSG